MKVTENLLHITPNKAPTDLKQHESESKLAYLQNKNFCLIKGDECYSFVKSRRWQLPRIFHTAATFSVTVLYSKRVGVSLVRKMLLLI